MKVPEIFVPEKKLDSKVEDLMKEKPLQKPQVNKDEIPRYAVQEDGDYLVMRGGIIINTPDCRSITSATFYFTVEGEEHKLHRGTTEVNWLDEELIDLEESLVSKLIDLGIISSRETDQATANGSDWWLEMKHATEDAYKELAKLVKNA